MDAASASGRSGGQDGAGSGGALAGFGNSETYAAAEDGSRTLSPLGDRRLALVSGEEVTLEVALEDADTGAPVADAHVSFSLQGRQDATLAELSVPTDDAGVARNRLMAGELNGTFTVEVSAAGAAPVTIQVAVSDAGFGTLVVQAPYTGKRLVTQRHIAVVSMQACDTVSPDPGDHVALLTDAAVVESDFVLPAGQHYTVVALAEGEGGTLLATSCAPDVAIEAGQASVALLRFEDRPLVPGGTYDLLAKLEADAPAATLQDAFLGGALLALETDPGGERNADMAEARLLLDALQATLRQGAGLAADPAALADSLAAERTTPTVDPVVDAQLQTALDGQADTGARSALDALALDVGAAVATASLRAEIAVSKGVSWQPQSLGSAPLDEDDTRVSLDLSGQDPQQVETTLLPAEDGMGIEGLRFALPWGGLAARAGRQLVSDGQGGHTAVLRTQFGCDTFGSFVAELPLLESMCDPACALAACDHAIDQLVDAGAAAVTALDTARPEVTLSAELRLHDDTGDLGVERMDASRLEGHWEAAGGGSGDAFSGDASGEVLRSARTPADAPPPTQ